ncbi:hypothetical protein A8L34_25785 [Bacillus sp. FJAT-27264]|uniref:metallophosphoesterase family protein n=1 Tax=Paenibacillus sp. (strain DSM 101736 / FJAT-27264) TaxID=1850362 RepID=UPI000807F2C0|nr:metallophosphoesterase [Bacillus sp. FJAT-27264]OBZ07548.1 hypothetical protein A8L34_25785 [Bacillus sp. FJAT-27264]
MVKIFHISDLHFPTSNWVGSETSIYNGLHKLMEEEYDESTYFLISGDITFKGADDGYNEARRFFTRLMSELRINRKKIILCPGNHDIAGHNAFQQFDSFSNLLREDDIWTFSTKNAIFFETDDAYFLGINSSYRKDHKYGSVDLDEVERCLKSSPMDEEKPRIVIIHHHLLNQYLQDISAIRNVYPFILMLDHFKFHYIFHGHQHTDQLIPIGNSPIYSCGIRTLGFHTMGVNNSCKMYQLTKDELTIKHYSYSSDHPIEGRLGGFKKYNETKIIRGAYR